MVGLYEFQITTNTDCFGPFIRAFDSGGAPTVRDFATSPELFRAEGLPAGTYPCVAMKITDVMEFTSAVTSGGCAAGVTNRGDAYRTGGEPKPFRDLDLVIVPATGTDEVPSEDGIYILFTTSPTAAHDRGSAMNQLGTLKSGLVVPDAVTLHWDASNAVVDAGDRCVLEPDPPAFFW